MRRIGQGLGWWAEVDVAWWAVRLMGVAMDTDEAGGAVPQIRYAKSEDGYIAYQVFGRGPTT